MTNGFYKTDNFSVTEIKKFVRAAMRLAYIVNCQSKIKWDRQIVKTLYVDQFIRDALATNDRKLFVIDRYAYYQGQIKKENCEYEICLHYNSNFLYIFVNEENFNKLIKKFNLKLTEW